jgi:uncharacterized protein
MLEFRYLIESAYQEAKQGQWYKPLKDWAKAPALGNRCSRYQKPESGWTFLHQAAYFGHAQACLDLIRRGAAIDARSHDSRTPADVARQKGHTKLAELLEQSCIRDKELWGPPTDPEVLPSSNRWDEGKPAFAEADMFVAYGDNLLRIPQGSRYFHDSVGRVLIGWHGSYNPPSDMGGFSTVSSEYGYGDE